MYRIAICDDDKHICGRLEEQILLYGKEYHRAFDITVFFHGNELLSRLENQTLCTQDQIIYDAIFLDICLQDISGIEAGRRIRSLAQTYDIPIIFISSFKDYALQLFKLRPFDFLVKPIRKSALFEVLEELCHKLENNRQIFTCKCGNVFQRIPYHDILYFSSNDKKVSIITSEGSFEFWGKLKDVESTTGGYFLTIHKSFLINVDYVKQFTYDHVEMVNGRILNISQAKRSSVRNALLQMMKGELR